MAALWESMSLSCSALYGEKTRVCSPRLLLTLGSRESTSLTLFVIPMTETLALWRCSLTLG
jgi:hypothetical protein